MNDSETERLSRPVFFDRQSLTRDDLNCLVDYVRETRRRHNRHVVGWGVTCGLPITGVDGAPWQVAVGRGYAIMPSGEDVAVPEGAPPFDICEAARACLGIPGPCPAPLDLESPTEAAGARSADFTVLPEGSGPNPRPLDWATIEVFAATGGPADVTRIQRFGAITGLDLGFRTVLSLDAPADAVRVELAHASRPPLLIARDAAGDELDRQAVTVGNLEPQVVTLEGAGISSVEIEAPQNEALLLRLDVPSTARGEVYLALCPDEEPARFQPGIPPHCQPPGDNIHPSRICEGYRLTVLCDLPEGHAAPSCDEIDAMICGPTHVPCPPDGGADCVVIATLAVGTEGIVAIDEFRDRRRLVPHWVLAERERCRCSRNDPPPTFDPTVFTRLTLPTLFTPPVGPTIIGDPSSTLGFDPMAGRAVAVDAVPGIGPARAARLRAIGVETLTDFVERGSAEIARTLGVSEVRVAELQDAARRSTVDRDR